jgi:porin
MNENYSHSQLRFFMRHLRLAVVFSFVVQAALAQAPEQPQSPAAQAGVPAEQAPMPLGSNVPACQADRLFPDAFGVRAAWEAKGLCIGLTDYNEVLGNTSGGIHQGAIYEGATLGSVTVDLGTPGLVPGGVFNVSGWQLRGHGLSADNLQNIMTVSNIEAVPGWRLFELWYDQSLANDTVSVRVGQQSSDTEFIVSTYAQVFLNSSFGWPALTDTNLPAGGSAFPLATPAVRLRVKPNDIWTLQGGVYSGSPAGTQPGNPQVVNRTGLLFPVGPGATWIAEVQANLSPFGRDGTYKLGAWYNDNVITELSTGPLTVPVTAHNTWSVYAVADQLLWRQAGTKDGGIGSFLRVMGAPADRSVVSFFIDGGVTWKGMIPGRDADTAAIGFGYAQLGSALHNAAKAQHLSDPSFPTSGGEAMIELTYQFVAVPGWTLQPDLQFIAQPGGGTVDPDSSAPTSKKLGNETVLGLRSTMTF